MSHLISSLDHLRAALPDEDACRTFLEHALWPNGRRCPQCGGARSWAITSKKAQPGLYACANPKCGRQFTVTTKTPLHATKLPFWRWIQVMWFILWSSKGVSSVVVARWAGISQKTAWKICQALRELMAKHEAMALALRGIVEIDGKFLGGAPRYEKGVTHKRGKGTKKPHVLIAIDRAGFVRSQMS